MYRIGIDLGGTNIAAGLVNEEFKIVAKASVPLVQNALLKRSLPTLQLFAKKYAQKPALI